MSQQVPFAFTGERVLPQKNAVAECIMYLWGNKRGSANPSADVAQVGRTLVFIAFYRHESSRDDLNSL